MLRDEREALFLARRRAQQETRSVRWFSVEFLLTNLARLGFLVLVIAALAGAWVVVDAHLTEQFLGALTSTEGLIDPNAGQGALTPDNIEQQLLAWSLRLREEELQIAAGANPRP